MPQSVAEGVDFFRWLVQLWRKAEDSIDGQQARALIPVPSASFDQQALLNTIALRGPTHSQPRPQQQPPVIPTQPGDPKAFELASLAYTLASRPPYPFPPGITPSVSGLVAYLQVPNTLGIGPSLSPLVFLPITTVIAGVTFVVKNAPTGANLTLVINVAGVPWLTLTMLATTTTISATPVQVAALTAIPAFALVTLDLTAVGTTFPGSDLAGILYA